MDITIRLSLEDAEELLRDKCTGSRVFLGRPFGYGLVFDILAVNGQDFSGCGSCVFCRIREAARGNLRTRVHVTV
jgi:hypothetical protein